MLDNLWRVAALIIYLAVGLTGVFAVAEHNGVIIFQGTWIEFTSIMLAAAAITLTGVGVLVAVAAMWGYGGLREIAIEAAAKRANEVAFQVATERANALVPRLVEARLELAQPADDDMPAAFPRDEDPK